MKIAHVNYIPFDNQPGVVKKIYYQAKASLEQDLGIDFIVFNSSKNLSYANIFFEKIDTIKLLKKLFRYDVMFKHINKLDAYDYIILRYANMDLSSDRFINELGDRLITEHHTKEIPEILTAGNISSKLRAYLEYFRGRTFLNKVRAIVGVTDEIRKYEIERVSANKDSTVVSNGIDVDSTTFTKFKKFDGKELHIIFVASYFAPWHGLNYILDALCRYNGKVKVVLHLIGDISPNDFIRLCNFGNKHTEVKIHGRKFNKELDEIFAISTIAISTIALFEKNMFEACPLKTREYIARGIPFIYGYKDTDLDDKEEFALKVNINNLSVEQMIEFAYEVSKKCEDISTLMRDFAKERLDWKLKIAQMYDFVASL